VVKSASRVLVAASSSKVIVGAAESSWDVAQACFGVSVAQWSMNGRDGHADSALAVFRSALVGG
jgi:hypothetical protein